jgi:putative endopeptidase
MDSAGIEKRGLQPLQPNLLKIEKIGSLEDFLRVTAELGRIGVDALMGGGIYQMKKSEQMHCIFLRVVWYARQGYYFNTDQKSIQVERPTRLVI